MDKELKTADLIRGSSDCSGYFEEKWDYLMDLTGI
jgi:hypothetical protein